MSCMDYYDYIPLKKVAVSLPNEILRQRLYYVKKKLQVELFRSSFVIDSQQYKRLNAGPAA